VYGAGNTTCVAPAHHQHHGHSKSKSKSRSRSKSHSHRHHHSKSHSRGHQRATAEGITATKIIFSSHHNCCDQPAWPLPALIDSLQHISLELHSAQMHSLGASFS